ncbi:unnamed protein product [Rhodiola kirilowii]
MKWHDDSALRGYFSSITVVAEELSTRELSNPIAEHHPC